MTAELKNWVFEWIGGSARAMGENDSQSKHIMGAVGTATRSGESAMGARGSSDPDKVGKTTKPGSDTGSKSEGLNVNPPTGQDT